MATVFWAALILIASVAFTYCRRRQKPAINGIYSRGGPFFLLKYFVFRLLLALRQLSSHRKKKTPPSESGGLGRKSFDDEQEMDRPQPFSDHPNAFDAVFFSGSNDKGEFFVVATERRQKGRINGVFYIMLPELGLCRGHWLPRTKLKSDSDDAFCGGGIKLVPEEPMRQWSLEFHGLINRVGDKEMEDGSSGEGALEITFRGNWSSDDSTFNYDTEMSASTAARAFAKEEWNAQYFKDLQSAHQTHYEQLGVFQGTAEIKSLGIFRKLFMKSFRDHSFGTKRDWKLMHRYVFHHVFLRNGWKAVIGVVCQPHTCTRLECGFVSLPNGNIFPLERCSLQLQDHGEGGKPPRQYSMTIEAGAQEYFVEVQVLAEANHLYGDDDESRIVERFAEYKVDGVPGSGIAEWQYRNVAE